MGVTEGWMWLLLIGTRGGGGGGSRPYPEKIKQISFFVFRGWRDLGKNKSHDFYLYITYSSG